MKIVQTSGCRVGAAMGWAGEQVERNGGVAHELLVRALIAQNFWMIVTPLGGVDT
jgi:hypothetical protein